MRKLDTFIHFVRYFCCLNMLECGKYFFPCTTLFPGLNFILTFLQGWDDQNQLLDLERRSASNSVAAALLSLQQELAKPPPVFDSYKALAQLESLVNLARDNADARTKRFSTILHQCSPLLSYGTFVLSKFNMWNRGSTFQNEFYSSNSANKPFLNWMLFSRSRQNLLNQTNSIDYHFPSKLNGSLYPRCFAGILYPLTKHNRGLSISSWSGRQEKLILYFNIRS